MNIEISLNLVSLVILLALSFTLPIILLLIICPWGNRAANAWLVALQVLGCLLALMQVALREYQDVIDLRWLGLFDLQLLIGPFIYFYTREQLEMPRPRKMFVLLHFVPALCGALLWIWQQPLAETDWLVLNCYGDQECHLVTRARFSHRLATYASILVYVLVSFRMLRSYRMQIRASYSDVEGINLEWLSRLFSISLVIFGFSSVAELHRVFFGVGSISPPQIGTIGLFAIGAALGVLGINQRAIGNREDQETEISVDASQKPPEKDTSETKYYTSSLTEEGAGQILEMLKNCMAEHRPHLQHGLKISQLASLMGVSSKHLSEAINGCSGKSFYEFVNDYRVEEASRLLKDSSAQHLSVSDIGYQAGFNSNSTFFQQFKKRKAKTPKQYRRELDYQSEESNKT